VVCTCGQPAVKLTVRKDGPNKGELEHGSYTRPAGHIKSLAKPNTTPGLIRSLHLNESQLLSIVAKLEPSDIKMSNQFDNSQF